ncbi:MAG: hypothetical protein WC325_10605 [Candidatus Bathyarchaeia archaeon]|jgi:hypothetical protein
MNEDKKVWIIFTSALMAAMILVFLCFGVMTNWTFNNYQEPPPTPTPTDSPLYYRFKIGVSVENFVGWEDATLFLFENNDRNRGEAFTYNPTRHLEVRATDNGIEKVWVYEEAYWNVQTSFQYRGNMTVSFMLRQGLEGQEIKSNILEIANPKTQSQNTLSFPFRQTVSISLSIQNGKLNAYMG